MPLDARRRGVAARALMWAALLHPLAAAIADGGHNGSQPFPAPGVPSPPLLQLGPKAVDVAWHRPAGAAEAPVSYEVLVTIQRARDAPAERIERSAGRETQFEFSPVPSGARTCFRVRSVGAAAAPAPGGRADAPRSDYSDETCYSNCECESALAPAGKGGAPATPARPPTPKPPRPAGPPTDAFPDDDDKFGDGAARARGGGGGSCAAAGAPTFVAGMLVGAALALAITVATCLLARSEMRTDLLRLNRAHGISAFGAKRVDEAAASEYAHLTAAEQVDAARADKAVGARGASCTGGGARRFQPGVALAELEASSASAQHAHTRAHTRMHAPPPVHASHHSHHHPPPLPLPPPAANPPEYVAGQPAYPPPCAAPSTLPTLEPAANVDPLAFEVQWVECHAQPALTLELRARAPRLPAHDAVELALARAGMVCIAAGAVGDVHKAYFAAQIAPTPPGELLMLELVVAVVRSSGGGADATATFRSLCAQHLHALSHHFGAVLTAALGSDRFNSR
ncbi:hypothetical protein KFE25_001060 [Diacronema lutheri]|uniref:Beta-adaptin appendage C-terminal subdomain domain-containing protein n=2 Tax=Diacronema lutheri TaxID=2081491 RepID=A0A8J5X5F8_DIALT|nr:hypothetical protein KFE25_001060 [Diacronema lutheri]